MNRMMDVDTVEFAKAIADETRQKIMGLCCCRQVSVTELVEAMGLAQPTISHHLKILKTAGLVSGERQGKSVMYTLNQGRLARACCEVAENFAPDHQIVLVARDPLESR